MTAQQWADRIQTLVREANADGYELWVDDEFDGGRIEVRVGSIDNTDDALVLEWNT